MTPVTVSLAVLGANESVQQPRVNARTRPAGTLEIWICYPKSVKSLESTHFNETGFDLALTKLKQVKLTAKSL